MNDNELIKNVKIFAGRKGIGEEYVYVIPKKELVENSEYEGECRNAEKAVWNGEKFVYERCKFGSVFNEEINHFEDDNGYDVFVPMEVIVNETI